MSSIGNKDTEKGTKRKAEKDTVAKVHEAYHIVNDWIQSCFFFIPVAVSIGVMYPLFVRSQKRVCRLNAY